MDPQLGHLSSVFAGMVGSILQVSDRKAGIALGVGVNAAASAMAAGAATGLVGSFGTASTGTAIASLFGAAKSTATLYWIGGLVGGGVAAGGAILLVGGAGAGFYAARKMRRSVLGTTRSKTEIGDAEQRILAAIITLKSSAEAALSSGTPITPAERRLFARIGIGPLLDTLTAAIEAGEFDHLRTYHRIRLRGHVHTLRLLQQRMEAGT